ncbi:MAG: HU family DNA-binding protein [Psittacicella sp.]
MNKTDIVESIALKTNLSKKVSKEALEAVLETIAESLQKGEPVQLIGFGTLKVNERKERQGVNPQTQAPITIPASKNVSFVIGKPLKDLLNNK